MILHFRQYSIFCLQRDIVLSVVLERSVAKMLLNCWQTYTENIMVLSIMMRTAAKLGGIKVVNDCPFVERSSYYTLLTSVHNTAAARKAKVSFLFPIMAV